MRRGARESGPFETTALLAKAERERRHRQLLRARAAVWREDPVAFAEEVLGVRCWSKQAELLRAVAASSRVAVRSGHKVGKSTALAILALWWWWRGGNVLATAPTDRLVRDVFWGELRRIARAARIAFPPVGKDPATGIESADGRWRISGYSTSEPERIAVRGTNWLFLVDEASGVEEFVFDALFGQAAGGAHIVLVGNPTRPTGTFADAFSRDARGWATQHISSLDSPNVTGEMAVPGLATREWIDERLDIWGHDSPLAHVRIFGNFAPANDNAVIPLHLALAAVERWQDTASIAPLEIGVDVARFGDDDSVVAGVRGPRMVSLDAQHGFDEAGVAGLVLDVVRRERRAGDTCVPIRVDACGVGLGVASILRQTREAERGEIRVIEVVASDEALASEEFPNVRSELWFSLGAWLREGGAILDDQKLLGELVAPLYSFDERSRRVVEKKAAFKRRLRRSPDRADALALAVYRGADVRVEADDERPAGRWGGLRRGYG